MKIGKPSAYGIVVLILFPVLLCAGEPARPGEDIFLNPESLVRGLYSAVSIKAGQAHDWDHVRKFFAPQAVLAVRKSPTTMELITVEEFVQWFVDDVEKFKMGQRGFEETVEKLKLTEFGDMAHCFVVYRARLMTPEDSPGQFGLDSLGLMRNDGRWWIVSLTNDVVTPKRPLPPELAIP
jgi:hypothetical protein